MFRVSQTFVTVQTVWQHLKAQLSRYTCPFTASPCSSSACGKIRGMQHSGQCNSAISVKVAQQNKQQPQPQPQAQAQPRAQEELEVKVEGIYKFVCEYLKKKANELRICNRLTWVPISAPGYPASLCQLVVVPPSYKQMNICKIHARNAAKKKRRQLTGTLTFLTTWHRGEGRCKGG